MLQKFYIKFYRHDSVLACFLKIKSKPKSYINEYYCWDSTPYDLLSVAYYNTKQYILAKKYAYLAYSIDKENERIINNIKLINKKIQKPE